MEYQYENLLSLLMSDIQARNEEGYVSSMCFTLVASEWLGYDLSDDMVTDGKGERGIDFWFGSDSDFEIFQVKSHDVKDKKLDLDPFGVDGVNDIRRAKELLVENSDTLVANQLIKKFLKEWNMALSKRRTSSDPDKIDVTLTLVLFGRGLTSQAKAEYDSFVKSLGDTIFVGKVPVKFHARLITIEDILNAKWRQNNRDWRDKSGKKRNEILIYPEGSANSKNWISGHNYGVFYGRAIDLVNAYEQFGYQIFEPNVRAHIKASKINQAIRDTLQESRGRKDFKFLNNGVTITCSSIQNPSSNNQAFKITEPGIVNGLQTIESLYAAYHTLPNEDKIDLEESCYVLIRVLTSNAVKDINKVVIATNQQNTMQPRNLKSNTQEQISYEKLFAYSGWFYERKEGAWDAFSHDPKRWRTQINKTKKDFIGQNNRCKRIDNHELAQSWLSFIGYSDEAVHEKRYIFEADALYKVAFLSRTKKHGASYNFDYRKALDEADSACPSVPAMHLAYLSRQFAQKVPLSVREAREKALKKANLWVNSTPDEQTAAISKDPEYTANLVLNGMSFLFAEFVGYVVQKALEPDNELTAGIYKLPGLVNWFENADIDKLCEKARSVVNLDKTDFLVVLWCVFKQVIEQMVSSPWKDVYYQARSRTRTNYNKDTRRLVYAHFEDIENYMKLDKPLKPWSIPIAQGQNVSEYVREVLLAV